MMNKTCVALAVALALALPGAVGCAGDGGGGSPPPPSWLESQSQAPPEPPESVPPPEPTNPPASVPPPSVPRSAVPEDLAGQWVSTGRGNSQLMYSFFPDGRYEHFGILAEANFEVHADGTVIVDGASLVLRPLTGTRILNGNKQPLDKTPQQYTWRVEGQGSEAVLTMTAASGLTITYTHG